MQMETNTAARSAALAGTRQMLHEDEFEALTGALIASGAVSKALMADALEALIEKLIAKARGEMETDYLVYPAEVFQRVRELSAQAARLRRG